MTLSQASAIEQMWAEGKTLKYISLRLGMNKSTVMAYVSMHRQSCPRRNKGSKEKLLRSVELVRNGCAHRDLMRELDVSSATATRYMSFARLELGK